VHDEPTDDQLARWRDPRRSLFPRGSEERVLSRREDGQSQQITVHRRGADQPIGRRFFCLGDASSVTEATLDSDGRPHGVERVIDDGELTSIEPYCHGLAHGVAEQWHRGQLIGTYEMRRGTGLDLWRGLDEDDQPYLTEARSVVDGLRHGFEWWIDIDQRCVHEERHLHRGELHGIERTWNAEGRLCRGYPRYWIGGQRVDKRRYLRASAKDSTLPPYDPAEQRPERSFPEDVARHLASGAR
jgi:hypothetical protein